MMCFFCGGAAHEATGCQYSERVLSCGPCTRRFWGWFRGHISKWSRKGIPDFYLAAGTVEPTVPVVTPISVRREPHE